MFNKARLQLTAWYIVIIMLISGLFSVAIYSGINKDYSRFEKMQIARYEKELQRYNSFQSVWEERLALGLPIPPMPQPTDFEDINQARLQLQLTLLFINLGIISLSGIAGFFLAGRTLRPIKEMVEEQNRFITDASHELRTPLTSLKSEIEVNLRDKKMKLADAKKLLESNLEEVNKLQYLSDNLIKLTQYQTGNGSFFETVNLTDIIHESVQKVQKIAKQKQITIQNQFKNPLFIEGETQTLIELFVIFLDNAIKYSPKHTKIIINPRLAVNEIVIEITDQGIGIEKEDLDKLFHRFYRADKARSQEGYGLGLSIAKQIVEKHHGTITVESEMNKGTTFFIHLQKK